VVQTLHQAQRQQPPPPRGHYLIIGDGAAAATAALAKAAQLGFVPQALTTHLQAEARETGRVAAALARDARPDSCLILGGRTAVAAAEKENARNQALALAAALALDGREKRVVAALDSSGRDGESAAAGAMISGETAANARSRRLDPASYLRRHNSADFFAQFEQSEGEWPPARLHLEPAVAAVNDLIFILAYAN
jgi:glycerate-2-kinase